MESYLYLFFALALIAEILGTVSGFGSSVLFVPIAGLFFDFQSVLGITALFHVSSNMSKIAMFRKGVRIQLIWQMGIPAWLGVIIGAVLSNFINAAIWELSLGIFLMLLSIWLLFIPERESKPTLIWAIGGGFISGFVAGLLGTGGAIRGLALAAYGLGKEAFVATSALIDMGVDGSRAVIYGMNGYIHSHDLYLIPGLLIVSILGTYLGKRILAKVSENRFKKMVLLLIFLSGLASLVKQIW